MKIGVDISSVNKRITGTGRYINCLVSQLNTFEHEIKLIPSEEKHLHTAKNIYGKIRRLHYRHLGQSKDFKKNKTDCAVFPNYFITPGYVKPAAVVIHDLSFITHKHFYSPAFVKYYNYRLKETLKLNPVIITVSNHTKREIETHLDVKSENIFVVQGYSDYINENNYEKEENYFLYVGHIEPRKNLTFLVENFLLWKEIRKTNIKLKLAGELWIKNKETKNLLRKYSSNESVDFLGYVSEDELKNLYRNASALVHTSFVEGFGFPILEAMSFNLPVLCSKNTAAEEISSPYSININPSDPVDLIFGFDELFDLKNQIVKYRHIQFSPELMREQLNPVLEKLESIIIPKIYKQNFKARDTEEAVLKTLLYAGLFNSGISKEDLLKNIFYVKLSQQELDNILINLFNKNEIHYNGNSVHINSVSKDFYKKEKQIIEEQKVQKIFKILNNLPFVSAVALSGGTANYGINNHNDIDVFIITKPHSAFIVYLLIHLFSLILKVRNELCANYLIDENNIRINNNRDIYT
ncbi:MAG: glycosyltransferase family 4 protein, partial [Melioribacteraceae bacterium]